LIERCTAVMATLNASSAEAALAVGPSAMTDVTGFGLLGHLHELAAASGVSARLEASAVPAIDGVMGLIASGDAISGGSRRNRAFVERFTSFGEGVSEERRALLCDAMTSGGLLVAVAPELTAEMEKALVSAAPETARVGVLAEGEAGRIQVV
jgi:selenide,water dikinase